TTDHAPRQPLLGRSAPQPDDGRAAPGRKRGSAPVAGSRKRGGVKVTCTVQRPAPPVELVNEVLKKAGRRVRAVKYLHSTSSTVRWPLWDGDTLHYYETSSGKEMAVLVTHPKRSRPFIRAIAAQKDRLYTWHVGWNG